MTTRQVLLAAAGLLSLFAVSPAPAGAARGMEVALQDDLVFIHQGA